MNRKWSRFLPPILVLFVTLMMSQVAFAHHHGDWNGNGNGQGNGEGNGRKGDGPFSGPSAAPEIDPRLVVEGLAVAGGAAALVWEKMRRRR